MAAGVIRELLVKLGVDADTAEVETFDKAIEGAAEAAQALTIIVIQAAAATAELTDEEKAAAAAATEAARVQSQWTDSLADGREALGNLATAAAAAVAAITAVVGALVYQGLETASTAAAIQDQAAALGITTDAYQELLYAVEKTGGTSEDLVKTLAAVNAAGEAAAAGTEASVEALAALGITAEEVAAASPEELLAMVADGLAAIEDPAARAAAATAILGEKLAITMIPALAGGSEGLEEVAAQAEALGIIMGGDALDAAAAFDDQIDQLSALLDSLRNTIGLAIIPVLSELVSGFMAWVEANREAIATGIEDWVGTVGELLTDAAAALSAVNSAIGGAEGWILLAEVVAALVGAGGLAYVVAQVVSLGSALYSAGTAALAIAGTVTGLAAGPLAILAAGIAATVGQFAWMVLVLEDVYTWITGGDSVIGRLIATMQAAGGGVGSLGNLFAAFGAIASAVLSRVGQGWDFLVSMIDPAIAAMMAFADVVSGYVVGALDALAPVIDTLTAGLSTIAGLIGVAPGETSTAGAGTYSSSPTATVPAPSTTASTSYAPSVAPTNAYSAAAAPVTQTVTNGSITITGAGLDKDEVVALVEDILETQARATAASFATGEA